MGVFENWKGSLYTMNGLIIKLVVWLGWLSCIAVGQLELSEVVTGFVNFPEVGISCVGNLAVLITSISKGRLDLEIGVRDVLASTRGPKVKPIHGNIGLTTCNDDQQYKDASVVMLSFNTPNSSIKHFMKYISNAHKVQSILLQCLPLQSAALVPEICNCSNITCKCIVFCTVEEITALLESQMPGPVKRLPDSKCLLPSVECLKNGCHGYSQSMLHEGEYAAACAILDHVDQDSVQKKHTCICVPLKAAADDEWTKLLITSFRSKDSEERRISAMASKAMENYTAQEAKDTVMARNRGREQLSEGLMVEFSAASLILPRLTEILINLLLTGWFRVDGFSTSMVSRKAVKSYVVGSKESGFAANAFLKTALLKANGINAKEHVVCQVLTFRGPLLGLRTLSVIAGVVNLICSSFWAVCTAIEFKWYVHSVPPSIPTLAVIIAAIFLALGMDCFHLYLNRYIPTFPREPRKRVVIVLAGIILEIACVVSGSAVAGVLGIKAFGQWVYSVVQALVWVKWGIGSYLLGELYSATNSAYNWKSGILVYSSAFFLNFMLAAVRCKWKYSPS